MGKLHQIKRAFNQLNHDTKISMYTNDYPLHPWRFGCIKENIWGKPKYSVPDSPWCFYRGVSSYRNYVTKLVSQYHHAEVVQKRHVFERAYLDGESWAVEEFDRLYRS